MDGRWPIRALVGGAFVLLNSNVTQAQEPDTSAAAKTDVAPSPAAPGSSRPDVQLEEIVVTGTLLRGIAPVGTNVIDVSRDQIAASGATSTQNLLATVPQVSNFFNTQPVVGTGGSGSTTVRPNIRGLPPNGGNTTLVLLDGHNMVGAGILATTPDAGVIPPGVIQKIDVVPDGASSTYGSDAVGGIVNLITRKGMEGVEVDAHYGLASHYDSEDANITGGHSWSSGSVLLSYDFRDNSDLLGANRDYWRENLSPFGGADFREMGCTPGNVSVGGVNYALPGGLPNTTNLCDKALNSDIFPEERQHSFFGKFEQDLTEAIRFDVTGYYTYRKTVQLAPQISSVNKAITAANPYFTRIGSETSQLVSYDYSSVFGPTISNTTSLREFGVTPEFVIDFGSGWNITALGNYGRSDTIGHTPEVNPGAELGALAATTTAVALDPYNIAATNPAVLRQITNYEQFGENVQTLAEARVIGEGPLTHLPGGDVRLALGAQYQRQTTDATQTDAPVGDLAGAARASGSRDVRAAFGEVVVPIIGADNAVTGVQELTLDGSARYDHYSDFGGTTNPKIGFTYRPAHDLTIRGNYGTSFNAPSLADTTGAVDTRGIILPDSPLQPTPFSFINFARPTVILAGGNPSLKPQTAHTYSIGGDYQPQFIDGLKLSLTFWDVNLKNFIEPTPFTNPGLIFTDPALSAYYLFNPTQAQLQALVGNHAVQGGTIPSLYASGNPPYLFLDARRNNLGTEKVNGLDFNGVYTRNTVVGEVTASVGGTLDLNRTNALAGSAPVDELAANLSALQWVASLGTRYGGFTAQVRVNYSAGYTLTGITGQNHVDSFHPVDLFFAYELSGTGLWSNTTLTLNIDNVGDERPPFYNSATSGDYGVTNGSTYGRLATLGLHKGF